MSLDPVCGMDVQEEGTPSFEYQGTTYYFCCDACKKSFSESPDKYLSQEGRSSHGHHHGHDHHHH